MKSVFTIATLLNLALVAWAVPPFDPAGVKNVGNGKGGQFITGQCLSDADCGSGCCAGPTGICSGPGAQFQAGKTGCGFGSSSASTPAAGGDTSTVADKTTPTAASTNSNGGPPFDPAGVKNVGNGKGGQFITGQCLSNADCGSGCCAGPSGICSGPGAQFQAGKTGCGFGSSSASTPAAGGDTSTVADKTTPTAASTNSKGGPPFDPAGVKNVGNGKGGQFITGQCLSNADCGSGCCAGPSGICSGPGAQFQAGKTGCGFSSAAAGTDTPAAAVQQPATVAATSNTNTKGGPAFDPAGDKNVGNGKAGQFIGGQCLNSADCASGCCAGPSGICSGPGASTQAGKTGCGFVSKRKLVRM